MIGAWYDVASKYGREMTLFTEDEPNGVTVKGFIKALDFSDSEKLRRVGQLGEFDAGRYLYIGPPNAPPGDISLAFITCDGLKYSFRRAEPRILSGKISHWEGILKCLGADEDD